MSNLMTIINSDGFKCGVDVETSDFWWFLTNLVPGTKIEIHESLGLRASIVIKSQGKRGVAKNE